MCKKIMITAETGSDITKELAEIAMGFEEIKWVKTGCVITCHGGPGAFGIVGMIE